MLPGVFAAMLTGSLLADLPATVYVDGSLQDYTGHDGSTSNLAFRTIQEGVDAVAANGTVYVLPGVYDSGFGIDDIDNGGNTNRVFISRKIRLESTAGASETHIVGKWSATSNGIGEDAIRCVAFGKNAAGSIVKGFTIRDGASRTAQNGGNIAANHGGGVTGFSSDAQCFIVDCVVSNCVATRGGGAAFISAIRTLFAGNATTGGHGSGLRFGRAYASIFIGNEHVKSASPKASDNMLSAVDSVTAVVNCTFVGNPFGGVRAGSSYPLSVSNTFSAGDVIGTSLFVGDNQTMTAGHCVVGTVGKEGSPNYTGSDVTAVGTDMFQLASPFEGDFRPVAGGLCDGTGDTAAAPAWVPEEFRGFDFQGKPFVVDGKTCIGAVREAAEMQGGFAVFFDNNGEGTAPAAMPTVSGVRFQSRTPGMALYIGSVAWPCQIYAKPVPQTDKTFFAFNQSDSLGTEYLPYRYANYDGGCWFTLPPADVVFSNRVMWANAVRYVSPSGSDANSGKTEDAPWRTLAFAATNAPSTSVLYALPGTYSEGSIANISQRQVDVMTNRVCIRHQMLLKAVDPTPGTTVIAGYRDPGVANGDSMLSIRPVFINEGLGSAIQGFTLTDGATATDSSNGNGMGGGFFGGTLLSGTKPQMLDCVITNCTSSRGAAMHGGWAQRCRFAGNLPRNMVCRSSFASSCIFEKNGNANGGVIGIGNTGETTKRVGTMYGCTVYEPNCGTLLTASSGAINSVMYGETTAFGDNPHSSYTVIERAGNFANVPDGKNVTDSSTTVTDTMFANGTDGDYRLRSDSPAVGGGEAADLPDTAAKAWWAHYTIDDIENRPALFVNGRPTAGAVQKTVVALDVQTSPVAGVTPSGTVLVDDGESVTFTATGSAKRQCLGFNVDGAFVPSSDRILTWTPAAGTNYTAGLTVTSVFNTNWYVNANSSVGDDGNDGWTVDTPRRTLAAGVADAVAGDVVHLAKGVYDDGSSPGHGTSAISSSKPSFLGARVTVPAGVTLVGDEGPEGVIIVGKSQNDEAVSVTSSISANAAMGENALRCVFLETNACVRCVTLTGGATQKSNVASGGAETEDDNFGGGILGRQRSCRVEDCIITNNVGGRAAAVAVATAVRCRITGNRCTNTGAGGRRAAFYGCYLNDNKGGSLVSDCDFFVNSTAGSGNERTIASFLPGAGQLVANSVIANSYSPLGTAAAKAVFSNCVVAAGVNIDSLADGSELPNQTYTADQLQLDGNGVPTKTSPLVGYGVVPTPFDALYAADVDLYGVPRVLDNGLQDVGAAEYDWRVDYARDLKGGGAGRLSVPFASPAVTETASGVYVPGGRLDVEWGDGVTAIGKHRFKVTVTGNGTLDIYLNGELLDSCAGTGAGASAEPQTLSFVNDLAMNALAFVYTPGTGDVGGAYVGNLASNGGMYLIFR